MEYLFADAGFISLNEKRRREAESPRRAYARRVAGFFKGGFPDGGSAKLEYPALRFTVEHVRLKYCGDLLAKRY